MNEVAEHDEPNALTTELMAEYTRVNAMAFSSLAIPGAFLAILAVLVNSGRVDYDSARWLILSLFALMVLLPLAVGFSAKRLRHLLRELARIDDVRALPALLDATDQIVPRSIRGALRRSRNRLLLRVSASDEAKLPRDFVARLNNRLAFYADNGVLAQNNWRSESVLAALFAVEQIGDGSSVAAVGRLARLRARTSSARLVREAATACLPALLRRTELVGDSLLRPADSDDSTLLRAAATSSTDTSDLLLCPTAELDAPR